MKKLIVFIAPFLLVLAIVVPSFPQAQTNTQSLTVPFVATVEVPCANNGAGEFISFDGFVHAVYSDTVNGNKVQWRVMYNPQGLTAVGSATGTTYHATGVTRWSGSADVVDFPVSITVVNRFFMIGEGSGGNLKMSDTYHITINANGKMTVELEKHQITCQ